MGRAVEKAWRRRGHVAGWHTTHNLGRRHGSRREVRWEHMGHRHVASRPSGSSCKSRRWHHRTTLLLRARRWWRHLGSSRHPVGWHLIQPGRRRWSLQDLCRLVWWPLVGLLLMVMEGVFHWEAWWGLWAHLAWVTRSVVPRKVGLTIVKLGQMGRDLLLLLWLRHAHHVLVGTLRVRSGPHKVHQELCITIVPSNAFRSSRPLARGSLVVSNKILEKLFRACLWLRSGCKNLLDVLRWWPAQAFSDTDSVLLEWLRRSDGACLDWVARLRLAWCCEWRHGWRGRAHRLLL